MYKLAKIKDASCLAFFLVFLPIICLLIIPDNNYMSTFDLV